MNHGLTPVTVQKIYSVLTQYPQIQQAILYGSRAIGTFKTGSDIDLALVGESDLTLQILFRILNDLDELSLPYTFDLSLLGSISDPTVLDHIKRVGRSFYTRISPISEKV